MALRAIAILSLGMILPDTATRSRSLAIVLLLALVGLVFADVALSREGIVELEAVAMVALFVAAFVHLFAARMVELATSLRATRVTAIAVAVAIRQEAWVLSIAGLVLLLELRPSRPRLPVARVVS